MKCEYCENLIPDGVQRCPSCGATVQSTQSVANISPVSKEVESSQYRIILDKSEVTTQASVVQKSRTVYVLLGLFMGTLGIHNFYAARPNRAVGQLLTTLLMGWLIIPLLAVWIWSIVDICAITTDGNDVKFQ